MKLPYLETRSWRSVALFRQFWGYRNEGTLFEGPELAVLGHNLSVPRWLSRPSRLLACLRDKPLRPWEPQAPIWVRCAGFEHSGLSLAGFAVC